MKFYRFTNSSMGVGLLAAFFLVSGLAAVNASTVSAEAIRAMAELDRTYIPALGLSGQADQQAKAKVAFAAFEKEWVSFKTAYGSAQGFDSGWRKDLERVDEAVREAKVELFEKGKGPTAHEALEAVRMIMLESRSRQKIPYFLDSLTLFHNAMEELLEGKPASNMAAWNENEKTVFVADAEIAAALWKKVHAAEASLSVFDLSPKAAETYRTQWQAIDSALSGLERALSAGDDKAVSDQLGKLKPNFIKTFFLFGTFPG